MDSYPRYAFTHYSGLANRRPQPLGDFSINNRVSIAERCFTDQAALEIHIAQLLRQSLCAAVIRVVAGFLLLALDLLDLCCRADAQHGGFRIRVNRLELAA